MMSRPDGSDRRSHPRAPLHRPAVVFVGDKRLPAEAIDVSETGIGVALPGEGAAGTFVRVNFNVDEARVGGAPWLDVDGVVVRTHAHAGSYIWGIRFLSAPPGVVAGIKSHVSAGPRRAAAATIPSPPPAIPKAPTPTAAPRAASSTAIPKASSSTAIPKASSSTSIPKASSSTSIPKVDPPKPPVAASSPAAAPPRVASRQAHDLRALYRSALEQVKNERTRAKKK